MPLSVCEPAQPPKLVVGQDFMPKFLVLTAAIESGSPSKIRYVDSHTSMSSCTILKPSKETTVKHAVQNEENTAVPLPPISKSTKEFLLQRRKKKITAKLHLPAPRVVSMPLKEVSPNQTSENADSRATTYVCSISKTLKAISSQKIVDSLLRPIPTELPYDLIFNGLSGWHQTSDIRGCHEGCEIADYLSSDNFVRLYDELDQFIEIFSDHLSRKDPHYYFGGRRDPDLAWTEKHNIRIVTAFALLMELHSGVVKKDGRYVRESGYALCEIGKLMSKLAMVVGEDEALSCVDQIMTSVERSH